ncbi:AraC family transcriptional regulator [Lentzea cavernae]|uniref:AraC family transcriptional regulator n=1 Tax=Lentzea cavernae TaxID=2020703 RepID=UPI00227D84A2|nr:AraC family transcriptional regulator [Lentzea cavernae]
MDPLSDILSMVAVEAAVTSRLDASGRWGLRFSGTSHAKFGVVHRGGCWIATETSAPVRLGAGDCYLLVAGGPYTMAGAPDLAAHEFDSASARFTADAVDGHLRLGGGEAEAVITGGRFVLDPDHAALLLDLVPPVLPIPSSEVPAPALQAAMDLLIAETAAGTPLPGADLVRNHLAHIVLVQAFRSYVEVAERPGGWLSALKDPQLAPALRAVHAEPGHPWTVPELAQRVHLARSTFATRFRDAVGVPPLEYLLRLRMRHAVRLLRGHDVSVTEVGRRLGYASHSSFSHAFTRVMGVPPGQFRHTAGDA